MVHAERAVLADDLAGLTDMGWAQQSLCCAWTVAEVVAHLTAGASNSRFRWLLSVIRVCFDFDRRNARQLCAHRGANPAETPRLTSKANQENNIGEATPARPPR
ncbi:maleylpyruvate isomerase N-terminal domain-containing protein [Nocardia sp. CA-107356]|uniref:maleylpyruvate isomerase N-terminal domain-containing protein n=1 Tax=Nocardia sp. CA-107356 TaxID=3239972 RepID=UPI003D8B392D